MKQKAFTLIEILVVVIVLGVFAAIAYPNVIKWITEREVKAEVYKTINFIDEMKSLATSGKYGIVTVALKPNVEVYTMSNENYFNTYKSITANNTYKNNMSCDQGHRQNGFVRNRNLSTVFDLSQMVFPQYGSDQIVFVYPNAAHNPVGTFLCISKEGQLLKYMRTRKTERDPSTGKYVDIFIFCSKSNTTQSSCKYNARQDFMYKITIDKFVNTKVYKLVKKSTWKKIDG